MRHPKVIAFTRELILKSLDQLTDDQLNHFKVIHSKDNTNKPLKDIVESIKIDALELHLGLIERTIEKNKRNEVV